MSGSDSDFKRRTILGWNFTLMRRDGATLKGGEYKLWASRETKPKGYRSHDLLLWWWRSGRDFLTNHFEIEMRLSNGEMPSVSFSLTLPWIITATVKIGLPRRILKPWIYDAREFAFAVGSYHGVELRFGWEDDHMRSYYLKKIANGEPRPDYIGRMALAQGLRLKLQGWKFKNLILGKSVVDREIIASGEAFVPMPEGSYPAKWERERMVWRRARVPFPLRERVHVKLDFDRGIPVPGKGENSWDCDDDAVCGVGGQSVSDAIGNAVSSAMRARFQYAGPNWVPDAGWPKELVTASAGEQDG